ncbi:MAG TPA: MG2 domain-containing protein, partial [Puia sp.]|nr:MG2 domain-containing protein [Puia sp.]
MATKRVVFFSALFLLVFIVTGNAQPNPDKYTAKWRSIDSLISRKGLIESALAEVNTLGALARQEKNKPQEIKALVYRLSLGQARTDSGTLFAIGHLEKELAAQDRQPARAILQCMLAGLYQRYIGENRYAFMGRTNTSGFVKTDVATWSTDDFVKKIHGLYQEALADEDLLWRTPVDQYSPILIKGNTPALRPTLFDLLAHTALEYFTMGESIIQPSVTPTDSLSSHKQALLLFQRLIRRHLTDKTPDALIDIDLQRIGFIHQYSVGVDKEEEYMRMLEAVTDKYGTLPAAAEAWYLQAEHYALQANPSLDQRDSTGNRKAVAICEKVLTQKDSSEGRAHCERLLYNLRQQDLDLTMEKVNIPNRPFRVLVNWRNFPRLYLRLIRVDDPMSEPAYDAYDSMFWKKMLRRPVYRAWGQDLPETKDYTLHRVEVAIGSLPPGSYILLASTNANWELGGATMGIREIAVSNISYISQENDYYVLNRETGAPLADATVQLWEERGGNRTSWKKGDSFTTDGQGHFLLKRKNTNDDRQVRLEIMTPGDHLYPTDEFYYYYRGGRGKEMVLTGEKYEARQAHSYLFTDRSIYRPGQTVYFKGIELTKDADSHKDKPRAGVTIRVTLVNANGQKVDSLQLTTNEFGSYNGTFRLPEQQLNGSFSIQEDSSRGSTSFQVEEYKRPKFYVEYGKQQGSYRVGDSIRVSGFAKGYSGNGIDGAKVVYHITRRAHFRYPWLIWRRPMPAGEAEIGHGEVLTDAQGQFKLRFYALPDQQISPATKPEYDYEISADVTDINGETRNGKTTLVAGYTAIRLTIDPAGGDHLPVDSLRDIAVSATNLSGEPVGADVGLLIYPLQAPQRLIRQRLWEAPDRYILPETDFLDSFPHDEYREESKKESWEKGKPLWEKSWPIGDSGKARVVLPAGLLTTGWYLIEVAGTDKYGQRVTDRRYVNLVDGKTGRPANPEYEWTSDGDVRAEPGGKVAVTGGSSAGDVFVIRTVERTEGNEYGHFTLNREGKNTEWTITEADRGGFRVRDAFVKDNRLYTHYTTVHVPWTNKELSIHYGTYRDKTLPGSGEKWQMTISGSKGEQVSAEVL